MPVRTWLAHMWTFGAAISMGRPPAGERTDEVVAVRELRITGDRPVGEAVELDPPQKPPRPSAPQNDGLLQLPEIPACHMSWPARRRKHQRATRTPPPAPPPRPARPPARPNAAARLSAAASCVFPGSLNPPAPAAASPGPHGATSRREVIHR